MRTDGLFLGDMFRDRYVGVSDPAAGANLSYAVPAQYRVQLLAMKLTLTTSATVANRTLQVLFSVHLSSAAATTFYVALSQVAQPASLAWTYYLAPGNPDDTAAVDLRLRQRLPYPLEMWGDTSANVGWKITTDVDAMAAGDQISDVVFHFRQSVQRSV